jgi:uncharacterized protein
MDDRTARETIRFIRSIADETAAKDLSIVFHGGEPLLAPLEVWRTLFDGIKSELSGYKVRLSLQSNLWNLTDDFLTLFQTNNVAIGTSLDGPKEYCNLSRGEGYFDRTWASVRKANAAGSSVSAIATVTRQTLPHAQDIVRFFRNNGMSMVLHGAIAGMEGNDDFALTAADYAALLKDLFPWYVANRRHIRIDTLDHYVKGVVQGQPGVCTFRDCLGMFLSVAPTGDITSCQRFAGKADYCMGNIFDRPTLAVLMESRAARRQRDREKQAGERCAACDSYPVCKGGCYYNAIASGDGVIDPLCEAYRETFAFVQDRVFDEMQSDENMAAIAAYPAGRDEHPLFRKGAYISLSHDTHPTRIADNARRLLALYELSRTNDAQTAAQNLYDQKICGDVNITRKLLADMQRQLQTVQKTRNNCYIHVTSDCNLRCTHCYAEAGEQSGEMDVERFDRLAAEAVSGKFRQIIVTGGEPLVHTCRDQLTEICRRHRHRGTNIVLRTNLTGNFTGDELRRLAESFDQIVVSVDGNEQTHNARRGKDTYQNMTHHLEEYVRVGAGIPQAAELSLACVMSAADINGEPGAEVRALGARLHVKRLRFRPLLPLGRASKSVEPVMCEGLMQHVSPDEMLKTPFHPLRSCGIGQNLFIRSDGSSYPCYAWCGEHTCLGNVFDNGLNAVLASPSFTRLIECTVDTIEKCRDCDYRYLCGSACRAWGNQQAQNLNAAPVQCDHLKERAEKWLDEARRFLIAN